MKPKKQMATAIVKDVALKANVSTVTVLQALMNSDEVSQAARNRVEQVALEVGYLLRSLGRNMKRNKSRTILVIVPDVCDPFFGEVIRGIEVTTVEHGYLVLASDHVHRNQKEKTFIDLIITKQIDDVVLLSSYLSLDASVEEQRNSPPMVVPNEFAPELRLPTVHIDNLMAAFNAMNYLYELGHQRIGYIADPEDMPLCHYRLQGCIQASRRSDITAGPHYIACGSFTFEAGANTLGQLLSQSVPSTAVSCHNDVMALGALPLAERRGLKVSDGLSIVGFDNIALSEFCDPPLTTVSQSRSSISHEGMLLLLK